MRPTSRFVVLLLIAVPAVLLVWHLVFGKVINSWPITNEQPTGSNIIAFGDSLTEGIGAPSGKSYPDQLAQRIGRPVLNRGVGGETTGDALRRLDRDVLSQDPRIVIVCLGGNDMLRRQSIDQQFDNLKSIVESIQRRGALVVLVGVEGSALFSSGDHGERYESLARETGCVYVPDVLGGIMMKPSLMSDPIHPNGDGYAKVVDKIESAAGEYLLR